MTPYTFTVDGHLLHTRLQSIKWAFQHRLSLTFLSLILLTAHNTQANAEEIPDLTQPNIIVPEKIAGVETVNAEQLIAQLTSDKPPILIDSRIEKDREYGYIESSIGLSDIKTDCDSLSKISSDKNNYLMFYCNGVQCGRSVGAIKVALSCGYHNLSWFKGGFAEWTKKGYQYVKPR